ncbi:MAG TPA: hypothetical protein VFK02_00620 [Kofleriaceae bacterium]|nr:hypothetical protein [Kofleriaceae bacterium]
MKPNPTQALVNAMERDQAGVAVVWCPDFGLRDWLIDEVVGLARPESRPFRTSAVEDAIAAPDRMALLVPDDERAAVEELEGRRDELLADPPRTQPVVLFLLRDGDGQRALAEAPGLSSWVRGNHADPDRDAEVDVVAERARFESETGRSVEDWLAACELARFVMTAKPWNGRTWRRCSSRHDDVARALQGSSGYVASPPG